MQATSGASILHTTTHTALLIRLKTSRILCALSNLNQDGLLTTGRFWFHHLWLTQFLYSMLNTLQIFPFSSYDAMRLTPNLCVSRLLEVLDMYKPVVFEYARLNITHNVLSKRKLKTLVDDQHVRGWDDPRLYTLAALKRRGTNPLAINNFCRELGITRSDTSVPVHRLEYHIRQDLEASSARTMAVLHPLKVESLFLLVHNND